MLIEKNPLASAVYMKAAQRQKTHTSTQQAK